MKKAKPLKRSKTGMEVELHLIDNKGRIANEASQVIKGVKKKDERIPIVKECGKNLIEIGCYPSVETYNPALDMIYSLEISHNVARKLGLFLYPFATYPGKFTPVFSSGLTYKVKKKIFDKEKFKLAPKCAGFHHHYSLPKGVFDAKTKTIKLLKASKLKETMISSYNFEIAIDPIVTLFTQSSPFFEGYNLARDSRLLVYRGGRKLNYNGLYSKLQQLGGLPPYKQTAMDLLHSLKRREMKWRKVVKKSFPSVDFDKLYPVKLAIGWNPVKINRYGTFEQRGMDMNYPSILFAVTVLLKFCLKKIQREFIHVRPSDLGIEQSFKFEDNTLFIPPHTTVRNKLQKWSAYNGYAKKDSYIYAKRFFNFAKSITPKKYGKIIRPISEMIQNKESVSDRILKYAKRKGYLQNGKIGKKDACELSLHYSELFYNDLQQVKEYLNQVKAF